MRRTPFRQDFAGQSLQMQGTRAKATRSALEVQVAVITQRLKALPKKGTQKIGAPKKKTGTQPIKAPSVGTQVKKVMVTEQMSLYSNI